MSIPGAPNDQFLVKCIIIPQLMKINVIKAFSGVFQCCWENNICSFFPARHKKFPSQLDKIGWFPSQEFRALSNPSIQNDRTKAIKPGQNRFFSASAIALTSRRMFVTTLWEREGVLFFFFFFSVVLSLQSFYSQLGLKC